MNTQIRSSFRETVLKTFQEEGHELEELQLNAEYISTKTQNGSAIVLPLATDVVGGELQTITQVLDTFEASLGAQQKEEDVYKTLILPILEEKPKYGRGASRHHEVIAVINRDPEGHKAEVTVIDSAPIYSGCFYNTKDIESMLWGHFKTLEELRFKTLYQDNDKLSAVDSTAKLLIDIKDPEVYRYKTFLGSLWLFFRNTFSEWYRKLVR